MKFEILKKNTKMILLVLVILVSTKQNLLSQTPSTEDSVCFSHSEANVIAKDYAKLHYLDSILHRKDSIILNYTRLDGVRVDRINYYTIQVDNITKENTKLLKRSKRNLKLGGFIGLLIGLSTQLLF